MGNENLNSKEENSIEEKIENTNEEVVNNDTELTAETEKPEEETHEELKEENNNEKNISEEKSQPVKKSMFSMSFCAAFVDGAMCLGIAYVLEFIVNAIMKAALGYVFNNTVEALVLMLVIVQILYVSIMESAFKGQTLGKMLFNLKVVQK